MVSRGLLLIHVLGGLNPLYDRCHCALRLGVGWTQTGWDSLAHPLFTSGLPWVGEGLDLVHPSVVVVVVVGLGW